MNQQTTRRSGNDGTQRAKNKKYVIKRLWHYLSFYRLKLLTGFILTILANSLSLVGPYLIGKMIGAMENGVEFRSVYIVGCLMVAFYVISAILNYYLSIAMAKIAQGVVYKLREDLFSKITRVSVSYFDTHLTGDIISRMSYDIDTISTSLASDVMSIITSFITLIVSFVMMMIMSPVLVLVFILTIPLTFFVTGKMSKSIKKRLRLRNQQLAYLNGYTEEMITAQKTIQSYVQEDNILEKFDEINLETAKRSYHSGKLSTIVGPTVNFINNLSVVLVTTVGGILKVFGYIDLASLSSFMLYSRRFSGPINQMSNIVADIQSALAAAERVFNVLDESDETPDTKDAITLLNPKGNIEFKNVSFGYNANKTIIHNLNFTAKEGQKVAIVGPTGAGKTTIVNLLMRYYDLLSGKILLDGYDITQLKRNEYRKLYSMVLQDTWIFRGTVFENITYGNENKNFNDVVEAAKKARIHHYIMNLPKGYDTILSDDGISISKGQRQLLVIARAILSDSKILILDEATSNVDTHTEIKIQEAMSNLMEHRTSFIIAHRLSTIMNADLILVLKDGDVIESGNHQQLMLKKGFYYELFMSQFK
ncbi:ABC-type transport system, permease and ATPase components [Alteracholeplasma palmae J233]|uniref:ABC-type transport system, permease and ATPase components n=1 Tax=Alteracholeplasma palmae (strain ATCC 49389 / J233) TaxID=1318466 RepID=U4KKR7_ALTPJ|nr:ABC transporter ATP-binding protein [Alteracholeplasma palmae]CCV64267.1 ABC-type transport system, permease and ATPase components [Alteracholeplasma palmae J233]